MFKRTESDTILDQDYTVYDKEYQTDLTWYLGTTFVGLNIILSILLTLLFFKKRNHFPIRGRAPYLSLLQSFFANIVLASPCIATILWKHDITSVYNPSNVHIMTKILSSISFVSKRFLYWTWFIKI